MVALPHEGTWSIRVLDEIDRERTLGFLSAEPILNVFLISKVIDYGLGGAVPFLEIGLDGEVVCVAAVGSNIVAAVAPGLPSSVRSTALDLLAERILARYQPVRAIIADTVVVERIWRRLRTMIDPPTVVRLNQPVYVMNGPRLDLPDLTAMRYATLEDLDQLVPACAAMHKEEVGIDPLVRDPYGYRQRIRELVQRRRSLVMTSAGRIVFKCEFSAVTDAAIQLMGVWTSPEHRRRGAARLGMSEVCGHILRQQKAVTLFVNDFNQPAIVLYESIGFRRIGQNRALIW